MADYDANTLEIYQRYVNDALQNTLPLDRASILECCTHFEDLDANARLQILRLPDDEHGKKAETLGLYDEIMRGVQRIRFNVNTLLSDEGFFRELNHCLNSYAENMFDYMNYTVSDDDERFFEIGPELRFAANDFRAHINAFKNHWNEVQWRARRIEAAHGQMRLALQVLGLGWGFMQLTKEPTLIWTTDGTGPPTRSGFDAAAVDERDAARDRRRRVPAADVARAAAAALIVCFSLFFFLLCERFVYKSMSCMFENRQVFSKTWLLHS
jgi:hypothetical protein